MTLTQGHMSKVKVTHSQNPCTCHNSSLPSWTWIIFHNCCPQPKGASWAWPTWPSHISKVKVTVYTYPKTVCRPKLITTNLDLDNISHNCCPWHKDVRVISLTQGHISRSRSQCTHTGNPCLDHNSSLLSWIWVIFHILIAHDRRVCHDLDPWTYLLCQGHSAHIPNIVAAFRGMHVSPSKHSYAGLPRKCDYWTDSQMDRQTPDKEIPMCRYALQATQKSVYSS